MKEVKDMNKKEFYNKLNRNEKMNAVIYVASSYPTSIGLHECDKQLSVCEKFVNEHINVSLSEKPYVDSSVGVRDFASRQPWIDFRARIDEGDIDIVLVSSYKEACCRVGGYLGMTSILNNNPAVIYSIQEDKIYDSELLNRMGANAFNVLESNDSSEKEIFMYLLEKTKRDDLFRNVV